MQAPNKSGSFYFSYKKTHSIVLMAVSDYRYRFTTVETGRSSDSGVLNSSPLGEAVYSDKNCLNFRSDESLGASSIEYPYVFVGLCFL